MRNHDMPGWAAGPRARGLFARHLVAAAAAAVATAVQVTWVGHVLVSGDAPRGFPLVHVSLLGLAALVSTLAILVLLARRLRPAVQTWAVAVAMGVYWLLLDYIEFVVRVAAWSTFDTASIMLHVLKASALPILGCATALGLVVAYVLGRNTC